MKMKEIQRQELKTIRSTLTPEQVSFFSKKIQDKILMDRNYASAKNIMTYVSMRNEVDTKALIQTILNDGKICFVPVVKIRLKLHRSIRWNSFCLRVLAFWNRARTLMLHFRIWI